MAFIIPVGLLDITRRVDECTAEDGVVWCVTDSSWLEKTLTITVSADWWDDQEEEASGGEIEHPREEWLIQCHEPWGFKLDYDKLSWPSWGPLKIWKNHPLLWKWTGGQGELSYGKPPTNPRAAQKDVESLIRQLTVAGFDAVASLGQGDDLYQPFCDEKKRYGIFAEGAEPLVHGLAKILAKHGMEPSVRQTQEPPTYDDIYLLSIADTWIAASEMEAFLIQDEE